MTEHTSNDGNGTDRTPHGSSIVSEIEAGERPSDAVIRAVATLTNTPVLDLEPLYNVIDPEYLNGIADGTGDGETPVETSIAFSFNGCRVTVTQDTIRVQLDGN